MSCSARGAEQEDEISTSEKERTVSPARNVPAPVDKSVEKTEGHGGYSTSIETVALCVRMD